MIVFITFCALQFMKEMLSYLDHWKRSVESRKGPFSQAERKQMMLSDITQNGMRITSMFTNINYHTLTLKF